jgi:hypothetical protein
MSYFIIKSIIESQNNFTAYGGIYFIYRLGQLTLINEIRRNYVDQLLIPITKLVESIC